MEGQIKFSQPENYQETPKTTYSLKLKLHVSYMMATRNHKVLLSSDAVMKRSHLILSEEIFERNSEIHERQHMSLNTSCHAE